MTPEQAHKIMAHWTIWRMFEQWLEREDLWESEFPDFSERDIRDIGELMEGMLPTGHMFAEYKIAHKVLADRAKGAEA